MSDQSMKHNEYAEIAINRLAARFPFIKISSMSYDRALSDEMLELLESPMSRSVFREGAPSWGNKPMTSLTVQFDEGIPELYLNTSSLFDSQNNLYEVWSDKIDSHHKKYMKITQQETEQ